MVDKKQSTKKKPTTAKKRAVYVPDETEKYMSKKQLKYFKNYFYSLCERIVQSNEKLIDEMKDNLEATPDDNDRASKESEFSMVLRGRDRERQLMSKIEQAIKRIDNATFGYCDECAEPIGIERVLARPVATLCIECKNLQEEYEKSGGTF